MPIRALDHIYAETHDWDESVTFWIGLGFGFGEQWGSEGHRAGRLVAGDAAVVLAEVPADHKPSFNAFFTLDDANDYEVADGVDVEVPLSDTHWGTRWIRVRDPEGRIFCLEEGSGG